MKQRQIMSFCDFGRAYKVIKVYGAKSNPYRIYRIYNAPNKYGFITEHRELCESYENLASCLYWFLQNNAVS